MQVLEVYQSQLVDTEKVCFKGADSIYLKFVLICWNSKTEILAVHKIQYKGKKKKEYAMGTFLFETHNLFFPIISYFLDCLV